MPTANWLTAAGKHDARPITCIQIPDHDLYFSNRGGHYPVAFDPTPGVEAPHHDHVITKLPTITRSLGDPYTPQYQVTVGELTLRVAAGWEARFGAHATTIRGAMVYGYVTFPGLAPADAYQYLAARVVAAEITHEGDLLLRLEDALTAALRAKRFADTTYTGAIVGDIVKARFIAAGLSYPADFDTTAWSAWTAAGEPGSYTVTTSLGAGDVFTTCAQLLTGMMTVMVITREGKLRVERFADLGASPSIDLDLSPVGRLHAGARLAMQAPVYRTQQVTYVGAGSPVTRTVDSGAVPADWWSVALDGMVTDCGLTLAADAGYLAYRKLTVVSAEHTIAEVEARSLAFGADLLDTAYVPLASASLPALAQEYHRIVSIEEDGPVGACRLMLWSKNGEATIV
jgi:hypothetical protein